MLIRACLLILCIAPGVLSANCRQALVLALDVSGSVDVVEYELQVEGLAQALDAPQIRELILASPAHVALAAFEWSGPEAQALLLPWVELRNHDDIDAAIARIRAPHARLAARRVRR